MKKLFAQLFYAPKYASSTENTVLSKITVSIIMILLCLGAMSFSAYAYFTRTLSSSSMTASSASYALSVTVNGEIDNDGYVLIENNGSEAVTYTFTLSTTSDTTASVGYCKMIAKTDSSPISVQTNGSGEEQIFYSAPIWKNGSTAEKPSTLVYTLTVPAGKTAGILFVSAWGSCSKTPLAGSAITMEFAPANAVDGNEDSGSQEPAVPEDTTPPEAPAVPEDTTPPEETTTPEDTTPPEETTTPEDTTPPEESIAPEETTTPEEGSSTPENTQSDNVETTENSFDDTPLANSD